jgi:hypothetical protein
MAEIIAWCQKTKKQKHHELEGGGKRGTVEGMKSSMIYSWYIVRNFANATIYPHIAQQ